MAFAEVLWSDRSFVQREGALPNLGDTIVFKTEYSPQLRRFKIKAHVDRLLEKLRAELRDDSFLRDARVVIAHPSRRSLFVDTYCWNYVQDDSRKQLGKRVR